MLKAQAPLAAILESKMAASTLPVAILDYMATGSVLAAMMATGSVLAAILDSKMAARGACALSTVSAWTTTQMNRYISYQIQLT